MPHVEVDQSMYWIYAYIAGCDLEAALPDSTCGKWMHVFDTGEEDFAREMIELSISEGVCYEAKMSSPYSMSLHQGTGVICFYIDGSKPAQHEKLLQFMLDHDLFPEDDNGKLSNEPFKFDWQTREGQYDDDFVPEITLSDFVDLETRTLL